MPMLSWVLLRAECPEGVMQTQRALPLANFVGTNKYHNPLAPFWELIQTTHSMQKEMLALGIPVSDIYWEFWPYDYPTEAM